MNYQELNYVLCVAKHQSLTKAAQELYVSQPTLTKHLQKLEREMNGKLFSRNGNTYIPTYLGRKYMEYARKVLAVRQDWEKELKDLTDCKEGELNIAFPLMRSSCMVPPVLDAFCQKYPDIHINIFEEAYSIQEKLLLDDRLDFAIFNETKEHPGLNYEFLKKEEILLLMPPEHPLAKMAVKKEGRKYPWMDLNFLKEETFILHFPEQTTGQIAETLLQEYDIRPHVAVRSRNTETCVKLCLRGRGMCFVPETYVKNMDFLEKPLCFSIGEKEVASTLTIAYRKGTYLPQYAKDFIEIARENI